MYGTKTSFKSKSETYNTLGTSESNKVVSFIATNLLKLHNNGETRSKLRVIKNKL